ncbi:MAG: DUF4411 domain-containing protein [Bacteroidetes bacterium SW_11_45_7]|nr:MAG: DUF4411 domain-containing protein [Bacteroidetes bacterium SW_11_45_7]
MPAYLLDSNFFIQAYRIHYPFDVVPGFWTKVSELARHNKICSIDKVMDEIYNNEDELKRWCQQNLPDDFFKSTGNIAESYADVVRWAYSHRDHYKQTALDDFLSDDVADAWLVAYAYAYNHVIVTQEIPEPAGKSKIKIPDACQPFTVRYIDKISLFRELNEQF